MKLSSAEGAKLLKKLKSEYDALKSKESISSTFLASVGENPESVRPKYDYKESKAELDSLALKIRKLKHAINLFNTTTVIPGYDITIDEMLVFLPQLSAKSKSYLKWRQDYRKPVKSKNTAEQVILSTIAM